MPRRSTYILWFFCACCLRLIPIGLCKKTEKKVRFSGCCGAPVCGGGFCRRVCMFCKKPTRVEIERKTSFPRHPLHLSWEDWFRCAHEYATLMRIPRFQEFVESCQSPLQWHDHLRLTELFHEYIFLRPASLQLASMFRMRMCMHIRLSNASVFGLACHKFTQMLALCRANGVRVIHPIKIHAHFGIAFLCVTRISTKLVVKQKSEDGSSVVVCSNTYWHTMIPWIIRWITRFPKQKR